MAKKSTNAKMSKIKSTKSVRDEYLNNIKKNKDDNSNHQEHVNTANNDPYITDLSNEPENNVDLDNQGSDQNINNEQLIAEEPNNTQQETDNNNNDELINQLKQEINQLNLTVASLKEENEKLTNTLNEERKQLIVKLEEKANVANNLINEKKLALEKEKELELAQAKDRIYIDVISNFLHPIILFEQTIKNSSNNNNPIIQSYIQGYNMVVAMFHDKLNNLNVEQIDVNVGDDFNENFMEAFDVEHVEGIEPNKVLKVVSEGFVYKGQKVIKFTSVVVSK